MEMSIKGVTSSKVRSGLSRSLGTFYRKVTMFSSLNALPCEMFTCGVPYEASRTYRAMKSEFECRRSEALIEARRQNLRGF